MFEVGKKYKSECGDGFQVVEVLAATEKYAIIKATIWTTCPNFVGTERVWEQDTFYNWREYKEPRTITRWVNVYDTGNELGFGNMWADEERAIRHGRTAEWGESKYLTTIPITYTEPH